MLSLVEMGKESLLAQMRVESGKEILMGQMRVVLNQVKMGKSHKKNKFRS